MNHYLSINPSYLEVWAKLSYLCIAKFIEDFQLRPFFSDDLENLLQYLQVKECHMAAVTPLAGNLHIPLKFPESSSIF